LNSRNVLEVIRLIEEVGGLLVLGEVHQPIDRPGGLERVPQVGSVGRIQVGPSLGQRVEPGLLVVGQPPA